MKFLGFGQSAPPVVDTDQVIPLHWFEDGFMWKKVVVYTLFVFDEPLDQEILRTSLEKLVAREGYRKLGARLRKNANGGVEYHVPASFSASRPAVAYTHADHSNISAAEHPVGSMIPSPSKNGAPAVVGDPESLSELMRGPEKKTLSLDSWLTSDRPTLGLHVVSFRDRTCATISWPHIAFDALGKKAIIEGWTMMLAGREDEIKTPIGFDKDPLEEFGKHATEKHVLADRRVGNWGMAGYALRNVAGLAGAKEIRMVCIPAAFWEKMVADVRAELAASLPRENENDSVPFVTEGDVICAWWTRLCASHLGPDSTTTVSAQNPMSLRKVLEQDLLPKDRPFISMALGFATVVHPAKDILTKPLSWLALEFRRAISGQGTRAQVEAYAALQREFSASLRMPLFFGDSGMYNLFYSNWQKAGLFGFDFSGAAVDEGRRRGDKGAEQKPVMAKYIQCVQDPAFPEGWPISGKDNDGNYWISGFRAKGLWGKLEEELGRQVREGKFE